MSTASPLHPPSPLQILPQFMIFHFMHMCILYIYTCIYLHMYGLLVHLALLLCAHVQGWSLKIGQAMWEFSTKATDLPSLSSP